MPDTNEHTGARLVSKVPNEQYRKGWDDIFGTRTKENKEETTWENDGGKTDDKIDRSLA